MTVIAADYRVIEASPLAFLRDGRLAGIGLHLSRTAISAALGDPDRSADTCPIRNRPMLWYYDEISVGFSRADDRVFFIQILPRQQSERLRWRSPSRLLAPGAGCGPLLSYLEEHGVTYRRRRQPPPPSVCVDPYRVAEEQRGEEVLTQGGVLLTFELDRLDSMLLGVVA
jgi:hypothetical protein